MHLAIVLMQDAHLEKLAKKVNVLQIIEFVEKTFVKKDTHAKMTDAFEYLVHQVSVQVHDNFSQQNQEIKFLLAYCQASNQQLYLVQVKFQVHPANLASYSYREGFEMLIDCLLLHYFQLIDQMIKQHQSPFSSLLITFIWVQDRKTKDNNFYRGANFLQSENEESQSINSPGFKLLQQIANRKCTKSDLYLLIAWNWICNYLVADCLAPVEPIYGPNQYRTPSGCWNSCSDPPYSAFGDFLPALQILPFVLIPMIQNMLVTRINAKLAKKLMFLLSEMEHALVVLSNAVRKKFAKMANVFRKLQFRQSASAPLSNVVLEFFVGTVNPFQSNRIFVCSNGICIQDIKPANSCTNLNYGSSQFCEKWKMHPEQMSIDQMEARLPMQEKSICSSTGIVWSEDLCFRVCLFGRPMRFGSIKASIRSKESSMQKTTTWRIYMPTVFHTVAATPKLCGVTSTGEQIGFEFECEACKKNSVQYFQTKNSEEIQSCVDKCAGVKCYPGSRCVDGTFLLLYPAKQEPIDLCAAVTCLAPSTCGNRKCLSALK